MEELFKSKTYGNLSKKLAVRKLVGAVQANPKSEWVLAIVTDSQNKKHETKFCQAIVLYQVGKGGSFFYKTFKQPRISIVGNRMLEEARLSIDLAKEVIDILDEIYIENEFDWTEANLKLEIHCDLGVNGKSSESIKSVLGWITAEFGGIVSPQIKPDSSAASVVADAFTK